MSGEGRVNLESWKQVMMMQDLAHVSLFLSSLSIPFRSSVSFSSLTGDGQFCLFLRDFILPRLVPAALQTFHLIFAILLPLLSQHPENTIFGHVQNFCSSFCVKTVVMTWGGVTSET